MLEAEDVKSLRMLFDVCASDYWQTHYNFDKETDPSPKKLGKSLVDNILINAWIPLLFKYGELHGDDRYKERALSFLHQLPPEKNNIVRLWIDEGVMPKNAAESQSVIQRFTEYCSRKKCLECQLAYRFIKKQS